MKNKITRLSITVFFILLLYFLGILTKEYVSKLSISNNLFSTCYITNTGCAFGMLQNNSYLLSVFGIIVFLLLLVHIYRSDNISKIEQTIIIIFSSGALGNIVERISLGHVVDYIKFSFIDFPAFNVYDVMICTAVCLYCISFFWDLKNEYKNNIKKLQ